MLGYFPTPYPDETLFGLIARFQRTARWTPRALKEQWDVLTFILHIQKNIGWLKENLPRKHPLQEEDIVECRTLFRVFGHCSNPGDWKSISRAPMCCAFYCVAIFRMRQNGLTTRSRRSMSNPS